MENDFTGKMFDENGTWTKEYEKYRRDNKLCNSPMAYILMKREEERKKVTGKRKPRLIRFLEKFL